MDFLKKQKLKIIYLLPFITFLAGIFFAFSMPGYNIALIAWFGLIPLLIVLHFSSSKQDYIKYSFLFGIGFTLTCFRWMLSIYLIKWRIQGILSLIFSFMLWLLLAFYISLFFALFGLLIYFILKNNQNIFIKSLLIALCWVLVFNITQSYGQMAFPWALIEYSQYLNLPILQYAQYIGGIGIEFIIIFINSITAYLIIKNSEKSYSYKKSFSYLVIIFTCLLFTHQFGKIILAKENNYTKGLNVTLVQSDIRAKCNLSHEKVLKNIKNDIFTKIKNAPQGLIVIPEATFLNAFEKSDKEYCDKINNLSKKQDKTIVIGAFTKEEYKHSHKNSALIMDKLIHHYDKTVYSKIKLVPFGEFLPYFEYLPYCIKNKFKNVNKKRIKGSQNRIIKTSQGTIAPSICFEILFPASLKNKVTNNADIIVNIGNLSWFNDNIVREQFIAFSVMRAAESRKPLIASVNTGYSFIIDPSGKIILLTTKRKNCCATRKIYYTNEKSLYSKINFN